MLRVIVSANADASASAAAFCCSPDQSSKITPLDPRANSVHAALLHVLRGGRRGDGDDDRGLRTGPRGSPAVLRRRDAPPGSTPSSAASRRPARPTTLNRARRDRVVIDGTPAGIGIRGVADADGHEVELLRRRLGDRCQPERQTAQRRQVWSSHRRSYAAIACVQRLIHRIRDQAQRDEREHPSASRAGELEHRSANTFSLTRIVSERGAHEKDAEGDDDDRPCRDAEPADAVQQLPACRRRASRDRVCRLPSLGSPQRFPTRRSRR